MATFYAQTVIPIDKTVLMQEAIDSEQYAPKDESLYAEYTFEDGNRMRIFGNRVILFEGDEEVHWYRIDPGMDVCRTWEFSQGDNVYSLDIVGLP